MQVHPVKIDRGKARELYRTYQQHRERHTPADREIAAIYRRIAQGQTVIRAFDSIRAAGLNEEGLPRLALARADEKFCECRVQNEGTQGIATFEPRDYARSRNRKFQVSGFAGPVEWKKAEAIVPLIPVHLRPTFALSNYHILWEAEWSRIYPMDPYLLRRFGGDAWLVVAAWDLTEVERAVMAQRLSS